MTLRDDLFAAIEAMPGVSRGKSRFSESPAFYAGKREFAHFHRGKVIDIRLTRAPIRDFKDQGDARMVFRGASDWVEFKFSRRADLDRALELVSLALRANR